MKLEITSTGSPHGTSVGTDDGRDLSGGIEAVSFTHEAGKQPVLTLRLIGPFRTGLKGSGEFAMLHPFTGEFVLVRAIEFADGKRLELTPAGSASGSGTSGQDGP